jgi:MFS transporter, OPA family, glycerol-3-phosphate transporter
VSAAPTAPAPHGPSRSAGVASVLGHSRRFRGRRLLNWFPLGLTYATMYMGRYNFNVVKGFIGDQFGYDKAQMGIIATAGFWTYALSVMVNGPLSDRLGGRKAILIGAAGAATMNLVIGLLFLSGWSRWVLAGLSVLYAVNMYFQSFGAASVVKVNAAWFHVRERGIFGGVFGAMISAGYFLALAVGGWLFHHFAWYTVFLVPTAAMGAMIAIDWFLVRDRPSQAGHADFDTADASAGDDTPVNWSYLVKKVFTNPVMVTIAAAEFCTGFVRQGLLLYFPEYLIQVHRVGTGTDLFWWAATGVTIGGIVGGLLCGYLSDHWFQSRRPPVAFLFYLGQVGALILLAFAPGPLAAAFLVGFSCMFIFGVHGMLSGTASMDFGGKKAAATAAGMLDGIQYVASGLTGFGLGWLLTRFGWDGTPDTRGYQPHNAIVWVAAIIPFSIVGALLMTRLWNAKPARAEAA